MSGMGGNIRCDQSDQAQNVWTVMPALKVGAFSGVSGLIFGGITGVLRSPNPAIHSIAAGIHWFAFGTSSWWLRSNLLRVQFNDKPTAGQRAFASSVSSGLSGGAIAFSIHRRFMPGAVIFGIAGFLGQKSYDVIDRWQLSRDRTAPQKPLVQRMLESKWMLLRPLPDEEYIEMLNEKLLAVDAEIAVIDDKIAALRTQEAGCIVR
ncbi:hypothetical protein I7I51_04709 [Histoplasma capsulatum]|uniref:Transmembrane protein n=1 Tax=Ajellomyces capsulatus TaxID=5037 RepID=A0A8A1M589_AJECA|nr:predicted protein [Histoplasma mississippiense (nom. inval.)]EDN09312.1 predicted protein [Histoplasma mississippiense (nom. inval.)]QSS59913.1 hypothetical protein I7I51_04709 [Histoplasma capsulatum]